MCFLIYYRQTSNTRWGLDPIVLLIKFNESNHRAITRPYSILKFFLHITPL